MLLKDHTIPFSCCGHLSSMKKEGVAVRKRSNPLMVAIQDCGLAAHMTYAATKNVIAYSQAKSNISKQN